MGGLYRQPFRFHQRLYKLYRAVLDEPKVITLLLRHDDVTLTLAVLAATTMLAPSAAAFLATSKPIPLEAPEMKRVCPASFPTLATFDIFTAIFNEFLS